MSDLASLVELHQKSEDQITVLPNTDSWPVDTPGGRFHAEWAMDDPVTREGSLIFFFQFLKAGGRWEELVKATPLRYGSNRGSAIRDVLGTMMLSVLAGHWRYAHINSVRGDGVNPGLLGMSKTVSEDTVRGALRKMDESSALDWLTQQNLAAIGPILFLPWILDIDNTVKPLYGHQEGAEIGYNPQKAGRPSHNYHSFFVANVRLCLGVDVLPGKQSSAAVGMPGLWRILKGLPRTHWPTFIRGDCAYGAETIMVQCEERGVPYLFKLKHSPYVKKLVKASQGLGAAWAAAGEGWEFMEAILQLKAWSVGRRVVLVREAPAKAPVGQNARRRKDYRGPELAEGEGWDAKPTAWSGRISVLVTSLPNDELYNGVGLTKLYRMRADAENIIDETKNQWGWCGYTTRKLSSCRIMANFIALIYNLWHLYIRFYDEEHHREAITSRPALMQGVGRQVAGGNQKRIKISLLHEKGDVIAKAVTAISKEISSIAAITEQWSLTERWLLFLLRIYRSYFGGKRPADLPPGAELLLSG
jgi:hypothetical protein